MRYSVGDRLELVVGRKSQWRFHVVTVAAVRQGAEEASYCLQDRGAPAIWMRESHLLRLRPTVEFPVGD